MRSLPFVLAALAAASCSSPPSLPPDSAVAAAWIVMGEDGAPIARAVTAAASCPTIHEDGRARSMDERAPAATIPARPTAVLPTKPAIFPVLTCESRLNPGARAVSVAGRTLPTVKAEVNRIVVIGDTGCRMKGHEFQTCNDPVKWPFARVAAAAAAWGPDLVIHVGDYHYRESACPDGDPNCAGPWGYGWDTWKADFFDPSASLLAAAPWVVVRGNHESCDRAGQGWWRFLDPRPLARGQDCNAEADDFTGDYSAPYRVPFGGDSQLIVFDSSKTGYAALPPDSPIFKTYLAQFQEAAALAQRARSSLYVMHHPILGFAPVDHRAEPGIVPLKDAMQMVSGARLFPAGTDLTIAGHVHLYEAVGFSSDHPAQLVVGGSGTELDHGIPLQPPPSMAGYSTAVIATLRTAPAFGYATLEREVDGWSVRFRDTAGGVTLTCRLAGQRLTCP